MRLCIILVVIGVVKVNSAFYPRTSSEFHETRKFHDNVYSSNQPTFYNGLHNNTLDRYSFQAASDKKGEVNFRQVKTSQTIVELAASTENLSTFSKAIAASGLVETLSAAGTYTLFAPNNDAFEKIDSETLAKLLEPEDETYVDKIKQFILRGVLESSAPILVKDFPSETITVNTMAGEEISVSNMPRNSLEIFLGSKLMTPGRLVTGDVVASNGVMHIIDACIGTVP